MGRFCPYIRKDCRDDCAFYRKGIRIYTKGDKEEQIPFEDCAINIMTDSLENLITRSIGQQKAIEQTRNGIAELMRFFQGAFTFAIEKEKKLPS